MKGLPDTIDHLIAVEFRRDGIMDGVIEPLFRAAREVAGGPLAWSAAERLLEAAIGDRPIYIATGHVHPAALPQGETDGPPGAAALARAIVLATTCPVVLFCEEVVVPVLCAACRAVGLTVRAAADELPLPSSVAVRAYPVEPGRARDLAATLAPEAAGIVTVEKIGRASDGRYYTGQAGDVSSHLAKVDLLVDAIRDAGGLTVGIGDLGNEIGMAVIGDAVAEHLPLGSTIGCEVSTGSLVVAGCSNWGAYGVAAAIAALRRDVRLMHDWETEREMILQCCRAGATDGFSGAPTMEADGASWRTHAAFVQLLRDVVEISLDDRVPDRMRFEGVG